MPNNPEMPALAPEQGGDEIEQLLSQLSPEQLEQLATELSGYMQSPEQTAGAGRVGDLASAIEAHLAQNPEAAAPEAIEPEKMAAFALVKSASYIEGFLNQAVAGGANIKQAVDMYDSSLTETLMNLKQAALKGNQYKLDVDKDGKIEASDLAKLRHEKTESPKEENKEHQEDMKEIKEAAYYDGLFERAREYGFSEKDTLTIIKSANSFVPGMHGDVNDWTPSKTDELRSLVRSLPEKAVSSSRTGLDKIRDFLSSYANAGSPKMEEIDGGGAGELQAAGIAEILKEHPYLLAGGGLAAAGGGAAIAKYLHNRRKQKQAAVSIPSYADQFNTNKGSFQDFLAKNPAASENAANAFDPMDDDPQGLLGGPTKYLQDPSDYDADYLAEYSPPTSSFDPMQDDYGHQASAAKNDIAEKIKGLFDKGKADLQGGLDWAKSHGQQAMDWAGNHAPELGGAALGGVAALALANHLRNKNKQKEQYS